MPQESVALASLATTIRSKNAKIRHVTLEVLFDNVETYEAVKKSGIFTALLISQIYGIPQEDVRGVFHFDPGLAVKATIRRPRVSGDPGESDLYGCQQSAPLFSVRIPSAFLEGVPTDVPEQPV